MASISALCPADRLQRRTDLVVRPLPEIGMCMVYRPRPARIVTLSPASWRLLEACDGATVAEIECAVRGVPALGADRVRQGLLDLVELSLVDCGGQNVAPSSP